MQESGDQAAIAKTSKSSLTVGHLGPPRISAINGGAFLLLATRGAIINHSWPFIINYRDYPWAGLA